MSNCNCNRGCANGCATIIGWAVIILVIVAFLSGCAGIKSEIFDTRKCWFDKEYVDTSYCKWKREQD